jgi:hypothetical protein
MKLKRVKNFSSFKRLSMNLGYYFGLSFEKKKTIVATKKEKHKLKTFPLLLIYFTTLLL